MFGKRVQRAQYQPVLCDRRLLFRGDQLVGGFADHVRRRIRLKIGANRPCIRDDRFGLGHDVERTAFRNEQRHAHERFESASETRFGTAHAFRDGAYFAMVTCEQGEYAVGFAEFGGAQHHAFVLIQRHRTSFSCRSSHPVMHTLAARARSEIHSPRQ